MTNLDWIRKCRNIIKDVVNEYTYIILNLFININDQYIDGKEVDIVCDCTTITIDS